MEPLPEERWRDKLDSMARDGLLRQLRVSIPHKPGYRRLGDAEYIDLSSNDYLGLASNNQTEILK